MDDKEQNEQTPEEKLKEILEQGTEKLSALEAKLDGLNKDKGLTPKLTLPGVTDQPGSRQKDINTFTKEIVEQKAQTIEEAEAVAKDVPKELQDDQLRTITAWQHPDHVSKPLSEQLDLKKDITLSQDAALQLKENSKNGIHHTEIESRVTQEMDSTERFLASLEFAKAADAEKEAIQENQKGVEDWPRDFLDRFNSVDSGAVAFEFKEKDISPDEVDKADHTKDGIEKDWSEGFFSSFSSYKITEPSYQFKEREKETDEPEREL